MGALTVDCPACGDEVTAQIRVTERACPEMPDRLRVIFSVDRAAIVAHVAEHQENRS